MSDDDSQDEATDGTEGHLDSVPDGAGCAEIWEHLSDRRDEGDNESDTD